MLKSLARPSGGGTTAMLKSLAHNYARPSDEKPSFYPPVLARLFSITLVSISIRGSFTTGREQR